MIWLFNLERASAISCDNYDDLFQYIHGLEGLKVSKVKSLLNQASMGSGSMPHKEEESKKQWCLEYCKNHHYIVVENTVPANHSSKKPRISQKHPDQFPLTREISQVAS